MSKEIVVLDGFTLNPGDNPWSEVESLGQLTVYDRTPLKEILDRAASAEILLTNKTPLNGDTIRTLDKLQFISVMATGYNIVDIEAAREQGIAVSNVPVYGTATVAQHVFGVLLAFIHRPFQHDEAVRAGEWRRRQDFSFWLNPLTELAGLTMGIVGFGKIGGRVAEIANSFGMKVVAFNPSSKTAPNIADFQFVDLQELFQVSDVISLHCPLTQQNEGLVNQQLIELAKENLILINSARGGLIDANDLAEALNSGRIRGACLDVFSEEPIAENNPLLLAKNCLITPHYAWATTAARKRLMSGTAANIRSFLKGNPINVVNPQN